MNLNIINCRGQCYDGSGNMAGIRSGLAAKIINLESRALYTHCYGHALNLAVQDMLKNIKVMERCLETVHKITKLIKQSPKRDSIIKNIKHDASNDGQGMRLLCPTRWTIRAKSLTSVDCTSRVPYISGLYEPSPLHQWTVRAESLISVDCSRVPYISGLYEPSPLHQWTVRAKSLTSVDCTSRVPYISGLYEPSPLHQFRRTT